MYLEISVVTTTSLTCNLGQNIKKRDRLLIEIESMLGCTGFLMDFHITYSIRWLTLSFLPICYISCGVWNMDTSAWGVGVSKLGINVVELERLCKLVKLL